MKNILVLTVFLLVGCTTIWDKPNANEPEFKRDRYACQRDAAGYFPVNMTVYGAIVMDANVGHRAEFFDNCMESLGYSKKK